MEVKYFLKVLTLAVLLSGGISYTQYKHKRVSIIDPS
jgi:hypothetical protein